MTESIDFDFWSRFLPNLTARGALTQRAHNPHESHAAVARRASARHWRHGLFGLLETAPASPGRAAGAHGKPVCGGFRLYLAETATNGAKDWRHRPAPIGATAQRRLAPPPSADWRHRPAPIGATAQRRLAPQGSLAPFVAVSAKYKRKPPQTEAMVAMWHHTRRWAGVARCAMAWPARIAVSAPPPPTCRPHP